MQGAAEIRNVFLPEAQGDERHCLWQVQSHLPAKRWGSARIWPLSSLLIINDSEAFLDQKREKFQEESQKENVSKGVEEEMQVCGSVGR